jgi:hypothetical protein
VPKLKTKVENSRTKRNIFVPFNFDITKKISNAIVDALIQNENNEEEWFSYFVSIHDELIIESVKSEFTFASFDDISDVFYNFEDNRDEKQLKDFVFDFVYHEFHQYLKIVI